MLEGSQVDLRAGRDPIMGLPQTHCTHGERPGSGLRRGRRLLSPKALLSSGQHADGEAVLGDRTHWSRSGVQDSGRPFPTLFLRVRAL